MELFVIIVLCSIIALQQIMHHIERKDLYNRIMSTDIHEYRATKVKPIKSIIKKNMDKQMNR